jgi:hypothetical protein
LKKFLQIKSKYFIFFLSLSYCLVCSHLSYGQNNTNNLVLTTGTLNFNLSTYSQIETEQSIANAFTVGVKSGSSTYHLYVRVSGTSASNPIPVNKLSLQLTSSTLNANTTASPAKISLTTVNQQLGVNTKKFSGTDTYIYKLFFGPVTYDYPPGTYTFTVLFSMTQP